MVGDALKKASDSSDGKFIEIKDIVDAKYIILKLFHFNAFSCVN